MSGLLTPGVSLPPRAVLEPLEPRTLLSAPVLNTTLNNLVIPAATGGGFMTWTLGLDGADTDGDALTYTVTSDDPNLQIIQPQGNRYAKLTFTRSNGTPLIAGTGAGSNGEVLFQLFDHFTDNNADSASRTAIERFVRLATDTHLPYPTKALAYAPDGKLYGVFFSGGSLSDPAGTDILGEINTTTGAVTFKGAIKLGAAFTNILALDFDDGGKLVGLNDPSGASNASLVEINLTDPSTTVLRGGVTAGSFSDGLRGFLFRSGKGLAINGAASPDTLLTSDANSSKPTIVLDDLGGDFNLVAATMPPGQTGIIYAINDNAGTFQLYKLTLDANSQVASFDLVGNIGSAAPGGGTLTGVLSLEADANGQLKAVAMDSAVAAGQPQLFNLNVATDNGTTTVAAAAPLALAFKPFFSDVSVHRIADLLGGLSNPPGWIIQTGDAARGAHASGAGTGSSPLGKFNDAFEPLLTFASPGLLAMANSGVNTNDAQFFITDGPVTHLNGKHMIFGQLISGREVVRALEDLPRDANNRPTPTAPLLKSVQVLDASPQDAVVTLAPGSAWDGRAEVTIQISDGQGGTVSKTVTVVSTAVLGALPALPTLNDVSIVPGTPQAVAAAATDASGLPLDYGVTTTFAGILATVEDATGQVTITPPAAFSGLFRVTVTAIEKGFDASGRTPSSRTFTVTSQRASDPTFDSRPSLRAGGVAYGAQVVGDRMYVAAGDAGLEVFDVTNPAAPVRIGFFDTPGTARAVKVVGAGATLTAFVADTSGGLLALKVEPDPADAAKVKITQLDSAGPPANATLQQLTVDFEIVGNTAYVAEYHAGLGIYDISDPANITRLGGLKDVLPLDILASLLPPGSALPPALAVDVTVKNRFAYVSDQRGLVEVIDIFNPAAPAYVTAFFPGNPSQGVPFGVQAEGNHLFITDSAAGLVVYDISYPLLPRHRKTLATGAGAWQVHIDGKTAVVADNDGYDFVDISRPTLPRVVYSFGGLGFGGAAGIGDRHVALPLNNHGVVLFEGFSRVVTSSFSFLDANDKPVTVAISGGGRLVLRTTGLFKGDITGLSIEGATPRTAVTITAPAGTTVGDISADGPIRSITARNVDLAGNVNLPDGATTLIFDDVVGGTRTITLGAPGAPPPGTPASALPRSVSITFDQAQDLAIASELPIDLLAAGAWTNTPGSDLETIAAPYLRTLRVNGDFAPNLTLPDAPAGLNALGLGTATIRGAILGGTWDIDETIGTIAAGSTASGWTLDAAGALRSLDGGSALAGTVAAASIGTLRTRGALTAGVTTTGQDARGVSIGSLTAGSVNATLNVPGGVTTFSGGTSVGGNLAAKYFGTVRTAGALTGALTATGEDARGVSFGSLAAGSINATVTGPGAVTTIDGGASLAGAISAESFGTVRTRGPLTADVTATGQNARGNSINSLTAGSIDATILAPGHVTTLNGGASIDGGLTALTFGSVRTAGALTGSLTATGQNGRGVSIGSLAAGSVNATVSAPGAITTLDGGASLGGTLAAALLGTLRTRGDLAAAVNLTGQDAAGNSIGTLRAGSMTGAAITTAGGARNVTVTRWIDSTAFRSAGNLGVVSAGGIRNGSRLLVGVDPGVDGSAFPLARGQFAALDADDDPTLDPALARSIGSLTITGVAAGAAANTLPTFLDSVVAAWTLKRVSLKLVEPSNQGEAYGLVAGVISGYSRRAGNATVSPKTPDANGVLDEADDFSVHVVG